MHFLKKVPMRKIKPKTDMLGRNGDEKKSVGSVLGEGERVYCMLFLCVFIVVLQEVVMTTGVMQIDDCLLEGHLGITKELVAMQSVQKRFFIGAENGGCGLIKACIDSDTFLCNSPTISRVLRCLSLATVSLLTTCKLKFTVLSDIFYFSES